MTRARTLHPRSNDRAFTLVEVLIAISIMAVAMIGLLRLQLVSIRTADHAQKLSRATLLAASKMSEALAAGDTETGTREGSVQEPNSELMLHWQTTVAEAHIQELDDAGIRGQRSVDVRVTWNEGHDRRQVRLTTCVANGR